MGWLAGANNGCVGDTELTPLRSRLLLLILAAQPRLIHILKCIELMTLVRSPMTRTRNTSRKMYSSAWQLNKILVWLPGNQHLSSSACGLVRCPECALQCDEPSMAGTGRCTVMLCAAVEAFEGISVVVRWCPFPHAILFTGDVTMLPEGILLCLIIARLLEYRFWLPLLRIQWR